MLVIDASVREQLRGQTLAAPSLVDVEVVLVWRGLARGGQPDPRRVRLALDDLRAILRAILVRRIDRTALVERCWPLRHNLTIYDAAYLALAEALQVALLTGDQRIARAPGPPCPIEVITAAPSPSGVPLSARRGDAGDLTLVPMSGPCMKSGWSPVGEPVHEPTGERFGSRAASPAPASQGRRTALGNRRHATS